MRELDIGTKRATKVMVVDERGAGGACYVISGIGSLQINRKIAEFGTIKFQNGPIKEAGINGCHNEDLIAIVIDRLQSFQSGEFACDENEAALCFLKKTLWWLNKRTEDRINRGVEGTSQA